VDHRTVEYLKRIGAERPTAPTPEALRDLHARHQLAVPFENLSIHLGEPIVLDEDSLFDKIVLLRRGGFCYELNGAFGRLLTALGFAVSYLAETRPRRLADFEPACWWQQTSVDSHFRRNLVCTMPVDGNPGRDPSHNSARRLGRVTLSGRRLIRTLTGERQETDLGSDGEILAAYRDLFGIRLDRVPQLAGLAGEPSTVPTGDRELQPAAASTRPNRQAK
jgi:arylamine N-acetyltransferase